MGALLLALVPSSALCQDGEAEPAVENEPAVQNEPAVDIQETPIGTQLDSRDGIGPVKTERTPGKSSNTVVSRCIVCQPVLLKSEDAIPLAKNKKFELGFCAYDTVAGPGALQTHCHRSHAPLLALVKEKLRVRKGVEAEATTHGGKGKKRAGTEIDLYYKDVKKFKKDNPRQKQLIEDLCLCVGKALMPVSIVESPWLRRLVYNQDPRVVFPDRGTFRTQHLHQFSEKVFLEETLPRLQAAETVSLTFDLWMSHKTEEIFSVVATFLTKDWVPGHCSLGLVKMGSTVGVDVAEQFKPIIAKHNLTKKVVAYVKDDGGNLHTCAEALSGSVSCEVLGLSKPKEGDCMAHAVSKSCGKATLKAVESRCPGIDLDKCNKQLQTCVTYTKKSGPGAGYLVDAQKQNNLPVQRLFTKVKTRFTSTYKFFKSLVDNEKAVNVMFSSMVPRAYRDRVPTKETWDTADSIVSTLRYPAGKKVIEE
ncbi:hypothetical protein CYMTET_9274 [Cymbomonas tetramitiformis]|uniref:Uncharacterized protein n=1 Tax=Cymbomonas tetramitiformis TaxID=36881 RepID=A0AAE0F6R1_9CHLO|nr:hypothetical protein CYMTET_37141 [Cymbomonas tetramitiformis]KAK3283012.1 hypothetical protein CYMTET_9274 [Cymbomonas tetramitiformis]